MKTNKGKSFVMIMIVVAVSALIIRTAMEGLISINVKQNESNAEGTLKLIAAALENFASDNHDIYPTNFSVLTQSRPAYLDKDYISLSPLKGYNFRCSKLGPSGYSCTALPARCGLSGNMIYSITTGNLLKSEACKKSEG